MKNIEIHEGVKGTSVCLREHRPHKSGNKQSNRDKKQNMCSNISLKYKRQPDYFFLSELIYFNFKWAKMDSLILDTPMNLFQ